MRATPDSLPAMLAKGPLPQVCLVTGAEPLLIDEACAALRARARAAGYGAREVHFLERGFDWGALLADAASLSLFANLRLIELKFRTAPDAAAAKHLAQLAERPPQDTLLLVTGVLEPKSLKTAWVGEFERRGVLVLAPEVTRERLPGWIAERLKQQGVELEPGAAELLADRVEGNLLAAQQAVERIVLLQPGGRLGPDAVAALVADSARYDVYELATAAYSGDALRALRILDGLRTEGQEPPLILWVLLNDLRMLSRVQQHEPDERSLDSVFRREGVWRTREAPLRAAVRRLGRRDINVLLRMAARADRVAKGSLRGNAWLELTALVSRIAGVPLAAA